ncbi:hypothetical protein [Halocynthiibacter namhaensis]|uniref:hypothetical protein n=1 Tax=Halocynthiibacter namhaensis TaxID=1290553 RepID=UPI00068ABB8F|nr:hypothetical protein [Halocynthiibacter namhaensis]
MFMSRITTYTLALVAAVLVIPPSLLADTTPSLRVQIEDTVINLDLQQLDALPQTEFTTTTIWTDDEVHFSGVTLHDLLEHIEASGTQVKLTAVNDYASTLSIQDVTPHAPLIATRLDGETMSVREKGPFWVIYPFDSGAEYRTEINFTRSVWQLVSMTILDE